MDALAGSPAAAPLAGGQSLLVLLRLRLTAPELLVDITRLPELAGVARMPGGTRIGAATTHAAIEDGVWPGVALGCMREVAGGIAYRAVRNLGTIGGSLALADPSADWPLCLLALDAAIVLNGPRGERRMAVDDLLVSAFTTRLAPGEIITGIEVPDLPAGSRWGYAKLARKQGAFADSLAAALWPAGGSPRIALGATLSRPTLLRRTEAALLAGSSDLEDAMTADIAAADPDADSFRRRCHLATLRRAVHRMQQT